MCTLPSILEHLPAVMSTQDHVWLSPELFSPLNQQIKKALYEVCAEDQADVIYQRDIIDQIFSHYMPNLLHTFHSLLFYLGRGAADGRKLYHRLCGSKNKPIIIVWCEEKPWERQGCSEDAQDAHAELSWARCSP